MNTEFSSVAFTAKNLANIFIDDVRKARVCVTIAQSGDHEALVKYLELINVKWRITDV